MGVAPTGVFGGTFDPPHNGHVALARRAVDHFGLARLLVRVVADPAHKRAAASAADRLALARLAFGGVPGADVSLDPHPWTVDSLAALALDDPVFLVGADELASFLDWKLPARVLELARLGVATRPGIPSARLEEVIARLPRPERVEPFELEPTPVSSSAIRDRVARAEPIDGLVPSAVSAEIERRALYR